MTELAPGRFSRREYCKSEEKGDYSPPQGTYLLVDLVQHRPDSAVVGITNALLHLLVEVEVLKLQALHGVTR